MARFRVSVTEGVDPAFQPYPDNSQFESNQCTIVVAIVVPVPPGQTRYVLRRSIDNPTGTVDVTSTINTTTTFILQIDNEAGKTSSDFTYEIIEVYLDSTSPEFYFRRTVSFNHGGQGC